MDKIRDAGRAIPWLNSLVITRDVSTVLDTTSRA